MRLFPNISPEAKTPWIFKLPNQSISLKPINATIGLLYINGEYVGKCNIEETKEQLKLVMDKKEVKEKYIKKTSSRGNIIDFFT